MAGLGLKRIILQEKNANFEYLKKTLESQFKKFKSQDGDFEIMQAESGRTSRTLKLTLMPSNGYTISYVRDLVGSHTLLYIRPHEELFAFG